MQQIGRKALQQSVHHRWASTLPEEGLNQQYAAAVVYPVITEVDESLQMQSAACLFPAELSVSGPRARLIPNQ